MTMLDAYAGASNNFLICFILFFMLTKRYALLLSMMYLIFYDVESFKDR